MTTPKTTTFAWLALCAALAAPLAQAEPPRGPGHGGPGRPGMVFDERYHHDHYYPAPGYVAPRLPGGAVIINAGPDRYWFHGGVWYRPYGGSFRVILPPVGVVIPVLPSAFVTLTIGGLAYYYANGVYYRPAPDGYAVVAAPAGADAAQVVQAPPTPPAVLPPAPKPDPIIYPRNGQSTEQLEADRRECNRWATTQPRAQADSSVFNRAVEACMDGRGYTMR